MINKLYIQSKNIYRDKITYTLSDYKEYTLKQVVSLFKKNKIEKASLVQKTDGSYYIRGHAGYPIVNVNKTKENKTQVYNNNFGEKVFESEVKEYQKTNSDIVGWLEIPNTNISYPVVQGKDNSYYMRRNFKKRYTINGSLFLDKDFKWNPNSSNLLIYGHNNRGTNEMFVELLKYKDESFYKEHPIIRFTTNEEDAIYEIISVFKSRVYYKRETEVFRYYYFVNAENEEEYNYFVEESKKASLYDIDATAEYGDQLITLSTCEYSEKDGRFVVVGRKIDN